MCNGKNLERRTEGYEVNDKRVPMVSESKATRFISKRPIKQVKEKIKANSIMINKSSSSIYFEIFNLPISL